MINNSFSKSSSTFPLDEFSSLLEKLVENSKLTRDREIKDPSAGGRALRDYVMYGNKSPYLRRSTIDEVKMMNANFLVDNLE